jgi:hypothetical protein
MCLNAAGYYTMMSVPCSLNLPMAVENRTTQTLPFSGILDIRIISRKMSREDGPVGSFTHR